VKDLERAGDVQGLDPGEGDDDDGARWHSTNGAAWRVVRKDGLPTNSATRPGVLS
jgi:hypothetical protein